MPRSIQKIELIFSNLSLIKDNFLEVVAFQFGDNGLIG